MSTPAIFFRDQPASRHISVGAFKDRLGLMLVTGISASAHPLCAGVREHLSGRKYIDLDRADLAQALAALVSLSLPEGVPGMNGTGPLTSGDVARVLGAVVQDSERP